jgi:hypothetical protein
MINFVSKSSRLRVSGLKTCEGMETQWWWQKWHLKTSLITIEKV